jgi:hypothetical protein
MTATFKKFQQKLLVQPPVLGHSPTCRIHGSNEDGTGRHPLGFRWAHIEALNQQASAQSTFSTLNYRCTHQAQRPLLACLDLLLPIYSANPQITWTDNIDLGVIWH